MPRHFGNCLKNNLTELNLAICLSNCQSAKFKSMSNFPSIWCALFFANIYLFVCLFICVFICLFYLFNLFIYLFVCLFVCLFIYLLIYSYQMTTPIVLYFCLFAHETSQCDCVQGLVQLHWYTPVAT